MSSYSIWNASTSLAEHLPGQLQIILVFRQFLFCSLEQEKRKFKRWELPIAIRKWKSIVIFKQELKR